MRARQHPAQLPTNKRGYLGRQKEASSRRKRPKRLVFGRRPPPEQNAESHLCVCVCVCVCVYVCVCVCQRSQYTSTQTHTRQDQFRNKRKPMEQTKPQRSRRCDQTHVPPPPPFPPSPLLAFRSLHFLRAWSLRTLLVRRLVCRLVGGAIQMGGGTPK